MKWVKIEITDDQDFVILKVTDSGLGISEKIRSKLFHPFFTTKPVGVGTGLGLSVTAGILESHGATIRYVPQGLHTCFEIRFKKILAINQPDSASA